MADHPTDSTRRKRKKPIIGMRAEVKTIDGEPVAVDFHNDGFGHRDFPALVTQFEGDGIHVTVDVTSEKRLIVSAWTDESDQLAWYEFDQATATKLLKAMLECLIGGHGFAQYDLGAKATRTWEEPTDVA